CAASIRTVLVGMDVEKRGLAQTVLQLVRVHVDHERDPIPLAPFLSHHVEDKPHPGRRSIKIFDLLFPRLYPFCIGPCHDTLIPNPRASVSSVTNAPVRAGTALMPTNAQTASMNSRSHPLSLSS